MNSRYDWSCPYVLRWGYDHRRAMRGAPAAAARVAEADFDGLCYSSTTPLGGLRIPRSLVFTIQKLLISEADVAPMRAHDGDGVLQWSNRLLDQPRSVEKWSLKHYPLIGRTIVGENGQNDRYFYLSVRYFQEKCFSDTFSTDLG